MEIDFTEKKVVGGYRRVTKDKVVVLTESDSGLIMGFQCRDNLSGCIGALLPLFMKRYNAVEEGEEFRWRNTRFVKLTREEVWKLVLDSPYKHGMFGFVGYD